MHGSNLSSKKRQNMPTLESNEDVENDPKEGFLDNLFEKRASAREFGLAGLTTSMKEAFLEEFVTQHGPRMIESIQKSMSKGNDNERKLASEMAEMMLVTQPTQNFADLSGSFTGPIKNFQDNFEQQQALPQAISALALTAFLTNFETKTTQDVMELLASLFLTCDEEVLKKLAPETILAAINGWNLLLTTLPDDDIQSTLMVEEFTTLCGLLHNNALQIGARIAITDSVALLVESFQNSKEEDEVYDVYQLQDFIDIQDLAQILEAQSNQTKNLSKKDKRQQRNGFKALARILAGHAIKPESLTFRGQSVTFTTTTQVVRLEFFRDILGDGFQIHMQENPLMSYIFNFPLPKSAKKDKLYGFEKKLMKRLRSQKLSKPSANNNNNNNNNSTAHLHDHE